MSFWKRARGSGAHHLHERKDAELNLIPLIDILSVMVAFLLVYSADVEVVQNTKGVEVPQSSADAKPNQSVVVMITREHVFVQGELVASVDDVRRAKAPYIESLLEVFQRPMLAQAASADDPSLASHEITLIADKSLPYEVVKKVMATCTAASYGRISLAVLEKDQPVRAGGSNPA